MRCAAGPGRAGGPSAAPRARGCARGRRPAASPHAAARSVAPRPALRAPGSARAGTRASAPDDAAHGAAPASPSPSRVVSSTPNSVADSWPDRLESSSRLRCVAASSASASLRDSCSSARMCGSAERWVSRTYCSSAPAAHRACGRSATPKPRRSAICSCSRSTRVALANSKCQGGRVRTTGRGATAACSSEAWVSQHSSSAGRRRSSSASSASRPDSSSTVKRPEASSSQASPNVPPSRNNAASRVSRRCSSSASSVTVPGSRCARPAVPSDRGWRSRRRPRSRRGSGT